MRLVARLRCGASSALTLLLVLLEVACASGDGGNGDAQSTSFIAFSADFSGFHGWQSFDVTKDAAPGTIHPDAQLIEYLNRPPPTGSSEFPVGTVIVKEGTDGDPLTRQFFAMVKRGANWNVNGATGWEWFELKNTANGGVSIVWRGVGPPAGEVYGGDPNAGCNTCHVACGNDAVCAKAVQLAQF
jgi:hypothetical protein